MALDDEKSVRADARRNRERLLEAARQAFSSGADNVPLDAIARKAGVGIGTLYRHFPTRDALAEAVYRAELAALCDSVPGLLAEHPAGEALRAWMDRFADYVTAKREMAGALREVIASGAVTSAQARAQLSGAVQAMLDAGAADGTLRGDVEAADVIASIVGVFLACGQPGQREQAGRLLDLLMDGLRLASAQPTSISPAPSHPAPGHPAPGHPAPGVRPGEPPGRLGRRS